MNEYVIRYKDPTCNEHDGNTFESREEIFKNFDSFYDRFDYLNNETETIFVYVGLLKEKNY